MVDLDISLKVRMYLLLTPYIDYCSSWDGSIEVLLNSLRVAPTLSLSITTILVVEGQGTEFQAPV